MRNRPNQSSADAALQRAIERLLGPVARLAVARGLSAGVVEEWMRRAFVQAASQSTVEATAGAPPTVSSIATSTGLTRREVTRLLTQPNASPANERPSLATQVFTRWHADRSLRDSRGRSKPLTRLGPAPSFEALAHSVTQDVHSRTLLDELCRLGLARVDDGTDRVHLLQEAFVPRGDMARMLDFLGSNAGDHLSAGVANVLDDEHKHFEQAIFADELSDDSIEAAKKLVNAQWRSLMAKLVPELEALVKADRNALKRNRKHLARHRLRIGLYSFDEDMPSTKEKEK
jgi:hypothetical protein